MCWLPDGEIARERVFIGAARAEATRMADEYGGSDHKSHEIQAERTAKLIAKWMAVYPNDKPCPENPVARKEWLLRRGLTRANADKTAAKLREYEATMAAVVHLSNCKTAAQQKPRALAG
jgi:hypothetical protein